MKKEEDGVGLTGFIGVSCKGVEKYRTEFIIETLRNKLVENILPVGMRSS